MTEVHPDNERAELVLVSAATEEELKVEIARVIAFINRIPEARLVDVAATCSQSRGEKTLAVVAESTADLRERLASSLKRLESPTLQRIRDKSGTYYTRESLLGPAGGKLAFVYPGAISFYPDMMRDLAIAFPECRSAFDELEEALVGEASFSPVDFIFPPAPYYRHYADIFSSGAYSQAFVSTFAGCTAMSRLLSAVGIEPQGVIGLGGGELAALIKSGVVNGAKSRSGRLGILKEIYALVSRSVDHGGLPEAVTFMVFLRHPEDEKGVLAQFEAKDVKLTIDLSSRMKVFAVTPSLADAVSRAFLEVGARVMRQELNRPFNSADCASVATSLKKFAAKWVTTEPSRDIYSCGMAALLPPNPRIIRNDTADCWACPVRFRETIRAMYDAGYRVFLEVGPRGLMTASVENILEGERFAALSMNSIHRSGLQQARHTLGQLASLGAQVDLRALYRRRGAKLLDFNAVLSMEVRRDVEMKLSRVFPKMMIAGIPQSAASYMAEPKGRGAKVAARAAAQAAQQGRRLQFTSGMAFPLISDAPPTELTIGVSYSFTKNFRISDVPFVGDFAFGASQLSYSDPNLRGLVPFSVALGLEIMAETALRILPHRVIISVEKLLYRKRLSFVNGQLPLSVKAERIASENPSLAAIHVQIRAEEKDADFMWPVMEATFTLAEQQAPVSPAVIPPLARARSVHWSSRDIYPLKLGYGKCLRGIVFAESWGDGGINYQVEVPQKARAVAFTRMPVWVIDPMLFQSIVSGFALWRSHERFAGAFSFPFSLRRMQLYGNLPTEGTQLNCYLRLTGVTPTSHLCDITVTSGDGNTAMSIEGWEELTERVPKEYCSIVLQPAIAFISSPLSRDFLGDPATDVSSAVITDVPYPIFKRNDELWLQIMSHVVLASAERNEIFDMKGSVSRRTEWLFGRIACKEAVRRYLKDYHQARWSYADIQIWRDDKGKPRAIGGWRDDLTTNLDVAIAHTAQFVIAIAAANAHVGVDVESVARNLSEEFVNGVFTPEELEVAMCGANSAQTLIRFWCAKEAVSKALGTGIRYSPKEMTISSYEPSAGRIIVRLGGEWLTAFKNFSGRDIIVTARVMRDHALAFCFIPSTLFDEN